MRKKSKSKRIFLRTVMMAVLTFTMFAEHVNAEVITGTGTEEITLTYTMQRLVATTVSTSHSINETGGKSIYPGSFSFQTGLAYTTASSNYDKTYAISIQIPLHSPTTGVSMSGTLTGTIRTIGTYGRQVANMTQRNIVTLSSITIDGTTIPIGQTCDVTGRHTWMGTGSTTQIAQQASHTFSTITYNYPKKVYYAPIVNSVTPPNNVGDQQHTAAAPAGVVADILLNLDTNPAFDPLFGINSVELGYSLTSVTPLWGGPATAGDAEVTTVNGEPPNDGVNYTGIAKTAWEQKVTDLDGDSTTFSRDVTITTSKAPDITITYGAGAQEPDGTSLEDVVFDTAGPNQYPNSMDGWSNQPLNAAVDSRIDGYYYSRLTDDQAGDYWGSTMNADVKHLYTQETGSAGWDLAGVLMDEAQSIPLSNTALENIKIDLTLPVPALSYQAATNEFIDSSTDTPSGINPALTKMAVVPHGAAAPPLGDYRSLTDWETCPQYGSTGDYDVYATVCDLAGNVKTDMVIQQQPLNGLITDLAISKTVKGKYGNVASEFEVTITLLDDTSTPVSDTYNTSGTSITSISFVNGQAAVNLKHGETLTIEGISIGYEYHVEETDAAVAAGDYTVGYAGAGTVSSSGVSGTLSSTAAQVQITNSRDADPLPPNTGVRGGNIESAVGVIGSCLGILFLIGSVRFVRKRRRS